VTKELGKKALIFRETELRWPWKVCGVQPFHIWMFFDSLAKAASAGGFYPRQEVADGP